MNRTGFNNLIIGLFIILMIGCATTKENKPAYGYKLIDLNVQNYPNHNAQQLILKIAQLEGNTLREHPELEIVITNSPENFFLVNTFLPFINDDKDVVKESSFMNDHLPLIITDFRKTSDEDFIFETTSGDFKKSNRYTTLHRNKIESDVWGKITDGTKTFELKHLLLSGPFWSFTPPSKILREVDDTTPQTVKLELLFEPAYCRNGCSQLPNHHFPPSFFEVKVWDMKEVIKNYFHSGVKITVLDARSLTPISDSEILLQNNNFPSPDEAFKEPFKKFADNLSVLGMPTNYITRTGNPAEFRLFPYFSSNKKDSVNILIRHPDYEPFQGYVKIEEEGQEWEILMPRIGQKIEVDEAPVLKSRIREKGSDS